MVRSRISAVSRPPSQKLVVVDSHPTVDDVGYPLLEDLQHVFLRHDGSADSQPRGHKANVCHEAALTGQYAAIRGSRPGSPDHPQPTLTFKYSARLGHRPPPPPPREIGRAHV